MPAIVVGVVAVVRGLRDLRDGEGLDDAGEVAELGGDGVAARCECMHLGAGPLDRGVGLGPGGTLRVRHVTPDRGTIETEVSAGDVAHLRGDVHRGA